MKHVTPSVRETAFNCPHCQAFAHQFWYSLRAKKLEGEIPLDRSKIDFDRTLRDPSEHGSRMGHLTEDPTEQNSRLSQTTLARWMDEGIPFLWRAQVATPSFFPELHNVFLSKCTHCEQISVWIHDRLVYPRAGGAPAANPDLPDDIRRDYDEASSILEQSPRGAAALMRLAIQKLCTQNGQPGENLNNNIAALVKAGLDPLVQQALDAVRVIGNNAVHPGYMDLRDDRATAESLFGLLNLIAEKMISIPKHIDEVYEKLPNKQRKEIEERDANN